MKASELMIDDWVEIQDTPRYYKVEGINILAKGDACRLTFEDYVVDTWCDRVKPIPLTEEILKPNGLDPISCCDLSMPHWFMSLRSGNHHVEMPFQYVHQLQHALRLCGLNDIADNFKI